MGLSENSKLKEKFDDRKGGIPTFMVKFDKFITFW